ncbi:replication-associated recombination protein A [Metamycoplasma hyosynoviae]|uniref:replication-associated recombination protein A n=1 Tax=Metamycoplasma hyosynoviae TaxID=29559 RepID=UPI00235FC7BF|nr:replication-associated recombination protein A [Metamycoplasma hyosynoviae]MDD1359193.1 replication-associated recombination protein A [Metamycoplasma hyosynoviae]
MNDIDNLANKLRPNSLEDFVCSPEHKILFENIIKNKNTSSFIFFGLPGVGKTTISFILAKAMKKSFDYFNAANETKENLITKLKNNEILIIDEIHRLNKDKQDILLYYLENSLIIVYATTTENPYFKVNPALRSRSFLIELKKPMQGQIKPLLKKYADSLKIKNKIDDEIYDYLELQSGFDWRVALNNFGLILTFSETKKIDLETVKKIIPALQFASDKDGENHYNYLSAFHKSLRGSDPDASLYYGFLLAKANDFDGLFRRMLCASYEDVGLANPHLATDVLAAIQAFERLGMPEGYLPIGYAILAIALSPKSNSVYKASSSAMQDIDSGKIYDVPNYLKDGHYKSAGKLNRGIGYKYPHDYPNHYISQTYLPRELKEKKYYNFNDKVEGYEVKIKEYWKKVMGE